MALRLRRLAGLVLALFACFWSLATVSGPVEAFGDRIQIALPLVGAACAGARSGLAEYAGRFAGSMVVVHGVKRGLGDAPINRRPGGGGLGFPSGHTAAAVYGASYLVRDCATLMPYAGPIAVLLAGFVGGSRIDAGRHDLVQVMAGAVIGLIFDLGFRCAASRRAARRWARAVAGFLRPRAVALWRMLVAGEPLATPRIAPDVDG